MSSVPIDHFVSILTNYCMLFLRGAAAKDVHRLRTQPLSLATTANSSGATAPPLVSEKAGVASLDAIVGSGFIPTTSAKPLDTVEEDLFALPMSPRSPEMKRSPFSML